MALKNPEAIKPQKPAKVPRNGEQVWASAEVAARVAWQRGGSKRSGGGDDEWIIGGGCVVEGDDDDDDQAADSGGGGVRDE